MIEGVRQTKLINSDGQEYDMTREEAMLRELQSFGWGQSIDRVAVDNGYIVTKINLVDMNPSGTMTFAGPNAYDELSRFRTFVQGSKITLGYKPFGGEWRYLDVVVELSYGEMNHKYEMIEVSTTFHPKGVWYEKMVVYYSSPVESVDSKSYPYSYPFAYGGERSHIIEIENGPLPSYMRIVLLGPLKNPRYTLTQNGETVGSGKINVTIPAGKRLVIDTDPGSSDIAIYSNLMIRERSCYQDSDFTTQRFITAPPGKSELVFLNDSLDTVDGYVEVKRHV